MLLRCPRPSSSRTSKFSLRSLNFVPLANHRTESSASDAVLSVSPSSSSSACAPLTAVLNAAAQIFGNGAEEYCQKYGSTWEHVAAIAAKNHQHSTKNPYSQFRNGMTTAEVLADKKVTENVCCSVFFCV